MTKGFEMTWTSLDTYREGLAFFTGVVDGVDPGRWAAPSPCAGWSALDVLGHVGEATGMGAATGQRVTISDDAVAFTRALFDIVPEERARSATVFAPARPAPPAATPIEALIAFTGRDPRWAPSH